MSKSTRKKQVCIAFEKGSARVSIDIDEVVRIVENTEHMHCEQFLSSLNKCSNLGDQLAFILQEKGSLKSKIISSNSFHDMIALSFVYFSPKSFPIRKSMEWVIDMLRKVQEKSIACAALSQSCNYILSNIHDKINVNSSLDEFLRAAFALNAMALIDRDIPWISFLSSERNFESVDILSFLSASNKVLEGCIAHISSGDAVDKSLSSSTSAEFLRYSECCCEALRSIMNLLKNCEHLSVDKSNSSKLLMTLVDEIMSKSCVLLQSDMVNKDLINASTMAIAALHWFSRKTVESVDRFHAEPPEIQLQNFLQLSYNIEEATFEGKVIPGIHSELLKAFPKMSPFSKSALVRGFLSIFDDKSLLSSQPNCNESILMGPFFQLAVYYGLHSLPSVRLCGLQVFESWFNKLDSILSNSKWANVVQDISLQFLGHGRQISSLCFLNWNHPAKQVSHMVPNVFERFIAILKMLVNKLTASDELLVFWKDLLKECLSQPIQHRGRYQSLTLLLPVLGAFFIIEAQPDILQTLIESIHMRDISSSSCALVVAICKSLKSSSDEDKARTYWLKPLALALCSFDRKLRVNTADYLLPQLFALDHHAAHALVNEIRSLNPLEYNGIWGLVNVCMHARLLGLSGSEIFDVSHDNLSRKQSATHVGGISSDEMLSGCLSEDEDLRYAALTALVASQRTCSPLAELDISILKKSFRFSLKSGEADHRQRVVRIVKVFFTRVLESTRVSLREEQNMKNRIHALRSDLNNPNISNEKCLEIEMKIRDSGYAIQNAKQVTRMGEDLAKWLCSELLNNLYPGCTFERELMSIEVLHVIIDMINDDDYGDIRHIFFNEYASKTILNVALSSWDKSRQLACNLLLKFPKPLPGFDNVSSVIGILELGYKLATSARQRESETGAFLLKTIMSIYCLSLGWDIGFVLHEKMNEPYVSCFERNPLVPQSSSLYAFRSRAYMFSLCDVLNWKLISLESLFKSFWSFSEDKATLSSSQPLQAPPLCHGLLNALRCCVEDCKANGIFEVVGSELGGKSPGRDTTHFWKPLFDQIAKLSLKSLHTAMIVIAEASTDIPFAPVISVDSNVGATSSSVMSARGPVNTTTCLSASYVNANSNIGISDGENSKVQDVNIQRSVVGAWLLVREATAMLAKLVSISPPPPASSEVTFDESHPRSPCQVLSTETITSIGYSIVDALGRLKHMGAIAETQASLQTIAEALLRFGERSQVLCRLPRVWLESLLHRLTSEQQVFILRRSAGFAYSFLALLRAEPANCKATLLPFALTKLLDVIDQGARSELGSYGEGDCPKDSSDNLQTDDSKWRMSVHALNVIRLIILDAALGGEIDSFIERSAILAMEGFKSVHWAIRNSSMMVFAAIVQRTIDNDKSDTGSVHASTAFEFFQRYPLLFPYILHELASITNYEVIYRSEASISSSYVHGWPVDVIKKHTNVCAEKGLPASAFPILLLLSKLRSSIFETKSVSSSELHMLEVKLELFLPLILSYQESRYHQIRSIASKAQKSLINVNMTFIALQNALDKILSHLRDPTSRINGNHLHGLLLTLKELLVNIDRFVSKGIFSIDQLQSFSSEEQIMMEHKFADLLSCMSVVRLPTAHFVLIESLQYLVSLFPNQKQTFLSLLVGESLICIQYSIPFIGRRAKNMNSCFLPYDPMTWRIATETLSFYKFCENIGSIPISESACESAIAMKACYSVKTMLEFKMDSPYSIPDCTYFYTLFLQSPISEIREGIIVGILRAWDFLTTSDRSNLENSFFGNPCRVLELQAHLVDALLVEQEPPVLSCLLELFSKITDGNASLSLFSIDRMDISEFVNKLYSIVCSNFDENSLGDDSFFMEELELSPTTSAGYAIEILGWIVAVHPDLKSDSDNASELFKILLRNWVQILTRSSEQGQPVFLRMAAIRSIQMAASSRHRRLVGLEIEIWMIMVSLIQDDDFDVRHIANEIIYGFIADEGSDIGNTNENRSRNYVLTYTMESIAKPFSKAFSHWILRKFSTNGDDRVVLTEITDYVVNYLDNTIGSERTVLRSIGGSEKHDLAERVFDVEDDNCFQESFLAANSVLLSLCVSLFSLCNLSHHHNPHFQQRALTLMKRFVYIFHKRCVSVVEALTARNSTSEWIGGLTYHKTVFGYMRLYLQQFRTWKMTFEVFHIEDPDISPLPTSWHPLLCENLPTLSTA